MNSHGLRNIVRGLALALSVSACQSLVHAQTVQVRQVSSASDLSATPPDTGHYRLHLIDVGTGLSVLVQGHDWNLLYDAGSADDKSGIQSSGRSKSRVIAYLYAALGPSGTKKCVPDSDPWPVADLPERRIDHMVLSHPHDDHGSLMDDVFDCYAVANMWDSGAINDTVFYDRIIERVAAEQGLAYNTAVAPPQPPQIRVKKRHDLSGHTWRQFAEGDVIKLDDTASFTILHANGHAGGDFNENSIVIRMDLGSKSLLLVGDAESGPRELPSAALGDVEKHLVAHYPSLIDVDILQVGHHGSKTSSRAEFVRRVSPEIALISGGPKKYQTVTLPDAEIVSFLEGEGIQVLRTDTSDRTGCSVTDRFGRDEDRPGGCDNYLLEW